jgi:hypothetical protein
MPFIQEWRKQIPIWNCPSDEYNLWNLKLSYLNQLQWIIIIRIFTNDAELTILME